MGCLRHWFAQIGSEADMEDGEYRQIITDGEDGYSMETTHLFVIDPVISELPLSVSQIGNLGAVIKCVVLQILPQPVGGHMFLCWLSRQIRKVCPCTWCPVWPWLPVFDRSFGIMFLIRLNQDPHGLVSLQATQRSCKENLGDSC